MNRSGSGDTNTSGKQSTFGAFNFVNRDPIFQWNHSNAAERGASIRVSMAGIGPLNWVVVFSYVCLGEDSEVSVCGFCGEQDRCGFVGVFGCVVEPFNVPQKSSKTSHLKLDKFGGRGSPSS